MKVRYTGSWYDQAKEQEAAGIAAVSHERTINPNMSIPLLEEVLLAHRI